MYETCPLRGSLLRGYHHGKTDLNNAFVLFDMPLSLVQALSEEVESLQGRLEELKEWCPEQSCCGGRVAAVTALSRRISRLLRCTRELTARSKDRIAEWSEITSSVSTTIT